MPIPIFTNLPPDPSFNEVADKLNKTLKELQNILLGLDTLNIASVHAKVIEAGTITGDKIQANAITAEKIMAGAITAGKIDVDELSAISANLGHITAGLIEAVDIFGSYIATSQGYPRSEMNSATNEVSSYTDATKYMSMQPGFGGNPLLYMVSGGRNASLGNDSGITTLRSDLDILIKSNIGDVVIECGPGNVVEVGDFYYFVDGSTGESLQQKLDELSNRMTAMGG